MSKEPTPRAPGRRTNGDHAARADQTLRLSWSESDRFVPRAFVRPFQVYMRMEATGGVVMLIAAAVALAWANSAWHEGYARLWETVLSLELGGALRLDHLTLREWVNDGLMTFFFFVVGMEIKRELKVGELRDPRAVALPAFAALGGMLVPAAIYLAFNAGTDASHGWGIPMATDIAFALGVIALLGKRIPTGAKIFLLTLAIIDDIGAILVIALFYTEQVSVLWLAGAAMAVAATYAMKRVDVRSLVPYIAAGVVCWLCLLESGVHAALAGVIFGLLTPTWSFYDPREFGRRARSLVVGVERAFDGELTVEKRERYEAKLRDLVRLASESASPLDRLEHRLSPVVIFGIVPLFAFANAGVRIGGGALEAEGALRVALGVGLGLVVGKTLGVLAGAWLSVRLGVGRLPARTTWRHVLGLAVTAGIGFTVALFVASLSFTDPLLNDAAKVGILGFSTVAGGLGYLALRTCPPDDEGDGAPTLPPGTQERTQPDVRSAPGRRRARGPSLRAAG